ncbi:MAG TPA: hypothetical protein VNM40_04150 [Candidatus Paceibacterota bacterium]|nr:hypothetical protein [Candidatus Paceibacterota bacterium]
MEDPRDLKQVPLSVNVPSGEPRTSDNIDRPTLGRDRTDPEVQHLPGNAGWTRKVRDAARKRGDQVMLWATTTGDRMNASAEAVRAATARARESTMTKRANEFSRREAVHSRELARLKSRTGMWNLPGIRSITSAQIAYHAWRERVNQRKASRADQRAERAGKRAETAEEYKRYFDTKISNKVDRVRGRWQEKLDAVRKPRESIDADIAKITDRIAENEALLVKIRERVSVLENTTGGDRAKRRDSLRNLYKSLAHEEAALKEKQITLARKQKHRIRLAAAEDTAEEALREFDTRYRDHRPSTSGERTRATTSSATSPDASKNEMSWSLRELAESKGNVTNEQIGKLWSSLFPNAELDGSYKTLTTLLQLEYPNKNISDAPDATMTVKELFDNMTELFEDNKTFQNIVEAATRKRGKDALQNLIGRMETHIAFADSTDNV